MPYAQPTAGAAPAGEGHGPFSPEDIQQIMAETGYEYEQVCEDIDRTGATTKEQLYPQLYSGQGIQPQAQTVGPGTVQGAAQPPPAMATPSEDGATAGAAVPPPAEGQALPPEALQAMHQMMAPPPATPGQPQGAKGPAWRRKLRDLEAEV